MKLSSYLRLILVFAFIAPSIYACTLWIHQWRTLSESRSYEIQPDVIAHWKQWYFNKFKKEPPKPKQYKDIGEGALEG